MAIWFTADTHFGHRAISQFCGRPFETKEDHDKHLINAWNSVVKSGDTVYHLGDFAFGKSEEMMRDFAGKLRGQINLIQGNHDKHVKEEPLCRRFGFIKDTHIIKTKYPDNNGETIELFLSHYPHRSWFKSFHGSFHLFGHVHGNLPPWGLSFDCGVDSAFKLLGEYRPFSLSEVYDIMQTLKPDFDPMKVR